MKVVTILLDKQNQQDWHALRCVQCGRMFCKVNRDTVAVQLDAQDGETTINHADVAGVEMKCRGCDCIYSLLIQ